ncbi:MAG: Mu-like prophage major head subunit gpT family protein [Candidatus Dormibacteria bacterium]
MAGGIITTGNTPKALWPGVHAWWGRTYAEHKEEWPQLFDRDSSSQNYEEDAQITGFGLAPIKGEGAGVSYDSEIQGFITRYTHVTIALGYAVTKEELEDNLYPVVSKRRAGALAFSFRQTKENIGANIYNRAFNSSFVGGDGVPLLNTAHPNTSGGSFSNKLAIDADLSEASLENLIVQMMGAQDDRGNLINIMPKCLVLPRQEWFNGNRILKSAFQPGSANNDLNVLKATNAIPEGIYLNHYLSSPHAWFVRSNVLNGMKMYQRVPISFEQDNDFGTDNALAKSRERYSFGWTDPRAVWGSNGP